MEDHPEIKPANRKPSHRRGSRPGKSTKPESVKTAVISRRVLGDSKMKIARDLGITTNTVRRILTESEMTDAVKDGRSRAIGMIPKALDAVESRLNSGDGRIGLGVLNGVGVLRSGGDVTVQVCNVHALRFAELKAAKTAEITKEPEKTTQDTLPRRTHND